MLEYRNWLYSSILLDTMKINLIFVFLVSLYNLSGQDFEILYGFNYYYSAPENRDVSILRTHINNDDPTLKVRFTLRIPQLEKLHLIASYHTFRPFVSVQIGTEDEINSSREGEAIYINGGASKTRIHRMGIGVGYKYRYGRLLEINPRIILNNELALETWGPGLGDDGTLGRYDYTFFTYSNPGFQILPELNLNTALKIYRGLFIIADYSYLKGFRPHMSSDVNYTIDGELQEQATFHTKGTSHHIMIGLKLTLWK